MSMHWQWGSGGKPGPSVAATWPVGYGRSVLTTDGDRQAREETVEVIFSDSFRCDFAGNDDLRDIRI